MNDVLIHGMTDQQLAERLRDADASGDSDNVVYYENEICARLNLSPNETEQGLTQFAADAIERFCRDQGVQ